MHVPWDKSACTKIDMREEALLSCEAVSEKDVHPTSMRDFQWTVNNPLRLDTISSRLQAWQLLIEILLSSYLAS